MCLASVFGALSLFLSSRVSIRMPAKSFQQKTLRRFSGERLSCNLKLPNQTPLPERLCATFTDFASIVGYLFYACLSLQPKQGRCPSTSCHETRDQSSSIISRFGGFRIFAARRVTHGALAFYSHFRSNSHFGFRNLKSTTLLFD